MNRGMKRGEMSKQDEVQKGPAKIGSLMGSFAFRLDPMRRITIPSVFRNRMGAPAIVYVLPSLTGKRCLEIFQPEAFENRLEELNNASLTDADVAEFVTMIGRVSETLDVDVQGRIRISDNLLDHIGVDRDVVIIGAMNRLQVWAAGNEPSFGDAYSNVVAAAKTVRF